MEEFIIEGVGVWRQKPHCYICSSTKEINKCERCNEDYCADCQASYNQFTQIDYNCCEDCANTNYRDYD